MPTDPNNPEVLTTVRTDVEAASIVGALLSAEQKEAFEKMKGEKIELLSRRGRR